MLIFCCECKKKVDARLTDGNEIYPHRPDLENIPYWKCDTCGNYVGCHYKTNNPTSPLGPISTYAIRKKRRKIHFILDQLWKNSDNPKVERKAVYAKLSERLGYNYHTGYIRSEDEADRIIDIIGEVNENNLQR